MGISSIKEETGSDLSLPELMTLLGSTEQLQKALAGFSAASKKAAKDIKGSAKIMDDNMLLVNQAREAVRKEDSALDAKREAVVKREARIEGIDADMTEREARIQQGRKELGAGQARLEAAREAFDKGIGAAQKKAETDRKAAEDALAEAKLKEDEAARKVEAMRKVLG